MFGPLPRSGMSARQMAISDTFWGGLKAAPMAPPGWYLEKMVEMFPWISRAMTRARASPTAIAIVVDVVGAAQPNDTVSGSKVGAGNRIVFGRRLMISQLDRCVWPVRMIIGRDGSR